MSNGANYRCPNECGAGYKLRKDGPHECAKCGSDMIEKGQSDLTQFGDAP